ncbi:MAG: phenylacetate-CoA oxygenase subunit PaaJ [Hyphomicrobiales bacterium]|nr:phenylacetate-CoA oxygenase subunit PaaJ [Hyphomicrobiales bacterium]
MVSHLSTDAARRIAEAVPDPEVPVLTLGDLGIIRAVALSETGVDVTITPTYSGCPAMNAIGMDISLALGEAGYGAVRIKTVLSPAWSTDWISAEGHAKLKAFGIAPPHPRGTDLPVVCPHCGSASTSEIAHFGSTACKALWRCNTCREPFDHFKCH